MAVTPSETDLPDLSCWGLIKSYARENPGNAFFLGALMFAYPIEMLLFPIFIGNLTRDISNQEPPSKILKDIAIIAVLNLISLAMYTIDLIASQIFSVGMMTHIQSQILLYIFISRETGQENVPSTELTMKMRIYSNFMSIRINVLRNSILPAILTVLFQSIYLTWKIDRILGLIQFLILLTIITVTAVATTLNDQVSCESTAADEACVAYIGDILNNFSTVLGHDKVGFELSELRNVYQASARSCRKRAVIRSLRVSMGGNVAVGALAIAYFWRLYSKHLKVISFSKSNNRKKLSEQVRVATIGVTIMMETLSTIRNMMFYLYELFYGTAGMGVIRKTLFCEESPDDDDVLMPSNLEGGENSEFSASANEQSEENAVSLSKISFAYPGSPDHFLFRDMDLHFPKGSKTAIVGPNGTGKTTLLRLILRHLKPESGELFLSGKNYNSIPAAELRSHISYATQQAILFDRTVRENIEYALPVLEREGETRVKKSDDEKREGGRDTILWTHIEQLGLTQFFKEYLPDGLDSKAGRNGTSLSGGQRQIVQLSRILLQPSDVIILDEITAAVDVFHRDLIVKIFNSDLVKNKTLIFVTHDPGLLQSVDRIVELRRDGNPTIRMVQ